MTPKYHVTITLQDLSVRFPGIPAGSECKYWWSTNRPLCQCAVRQKVSNYISLLALGKELCQKDSTWSPLRYLRQFHCSILQLKENILLVMSKWKTCFPTRLFFYLSNFQTLINGRNKIFFKMSPKKRESQYQ